MVDGPSIALHVYVSVCDHVVPRADGPTDRSTDPTPNNHITHTPNPKRNRTQEVNYFRPHNSQLKMRHVRLDYKYNKTSHRVRAFARKGRCAWLYVFV